MIKSVDIKRAAINLVNKESINDNDIGAIGMLLLDIAMQLECMEDQGLVSDSQLGLLKELQYDHRERIDYLEDRLDEALRIIDELHKQNKILKDALYK